MLLYHQECFIVYLGFLLEVQCYILPGMSDSFSRLLLQVHAICSSEMSYSLIEIVVRSAMLFFTRNVL